MGSIDDFLRAHVSRGLLPGEQVFGMLHVRVPYRWNAMGVPSAYFQWLGVPTSSRLLLFRTELDVMGNPEPRALSTEVWSYDEIARVELGQVEGLTEATYFALVPHPTLGPAEGKPGRYDMWPSAAGLDDHARSRAAFPPWLAQQVRSGAFPLSPEKRARMNARLDADRAAEAARAARQDALVAAAKPHLVRAGVGAALVVVATLSVMVLWHGVSHYAEASGRYREQVVRAAEDNLRDIRGGGRPRDDSCAYSTFGACEMCRPGASTRDTPGWQTVSDYAGSPWRCPPTSYYERRVHEAKVARATATKEGAAEQESRAWGALARAIVSALVLIATLVAGPVLFVWDRRRRAAAGDARPA